eukprot:m.164930 g.164930  ORF g.164930 m.164930 type:complete len:61 (+) comp18118_c0_seq1:561-743(+)
MARGCCRVAVHRGTTPLTDLCCDAQVDVPQFVIAFDEKSFGKLNKQTGFITGGVHGGDEL